MSTVIFRVHGVNDLAVNRLEYFIRPHFEFNELYELVFRHLVPLDSGISRTSFLQCRHQSSSITT